MNTEPNIKLFLELCDTIIKHKEQFSMSDWDCGTTACIAGWALRLSGRCHSSYLEDPFDPRSANSSDAARLLEIDDAKAAMLFYCGEKTAEQAVAFIHKCLDDWYPGWRTEKGSL
jgi:hypothetical protein